MAAIGAPAAPIVDEVLAPLEPHAPVAPVWALAGVLRPDGLHTEDAGGRPLVLGPADLELLDGLTGPTTAGDLLAATGSDPATLTRLAATGKIRHGGAGEPFPPRRPELARHDGTVRRLPPTADPRHPDDPGGPARIPVYALLHPAHGVPLGLAMVTAAARAHDGGRLAATFEIRRPELLPTLIEDLDARTGPAVLLLSDYIWTLDDNLRDAAEIVARHPEVIVVHGGPSAPRYEDEMARFLDEHAAVAHILVRGEGERTIADLLTVLASTNGRWDDTALGGVAGIAFRSRSTGELVRTTDRPRETQLDDLPSPYLTGELDHVHIAANVKPFAVETNRGCPYACSFCDWGAATNSRVRFFSPDRVAAEIDWLAAKGADAVFVADANFGLSKRDVETARHLAEARLRTGAFNHVYWTAAKNTTKHLMELLRVLRSGGIISELLIALQTTDEATLEVIGRSNISTDRLLELARLLRQDALPVRSELMLGLPGQTVASFAADLQLMFDQEMAPMTWTTLVLPNAPMNEPGYRERWGIRIDEQGVVTQTASAGIDDRNRMLRLRRTFLAADVYGTLRHVLRWLQQDRGITALRVIEDLVACAERDPDDNLAATWVVEGFDLHPLPPEGWGAFYEGIRAFVTEQYGVDPADPGLACVLAVQQALMPWPGRELPTVIGLEHDYVAYYLDSVAPLYGGDPARRTVAPLDTRPPGVLEVRADPADLGSGGMDLVGNPRDEMAAASFNFVYTAANELDSPLLRLLPEVTRRFDSARITEVVHERMAWAGVDPADEVTTPVGVTASR